MYFFTILAVLAPLVSAIDPPASSPPAQLPIEVYYEPLCPDSIAFFNNQLYPMYSSALKPRVNITFVPFGRANITTGADGKFALSCRHGDTECYGIRTQACAIQKLASDVPKRVSFLSCLMKNGKKEEPYPTMSCGESTGLSTTDDIVACANSSDSETLVRDLEVKTKSLSPALGSVPTIIVKGAFSEENQKKAITNLKGLICEKLEGGKPSECANGASSAAGALTFSTILGLIVFRLF